ncbi:phosphoribosylaminoimidazolesuccinocarboxamide synthase [Corynebacterium otitidis]
MRPELSEYEHLSAGKVREIYGVDDEHLLIVATDRISAYDHVLDTPIPDKGRVLTAMSFAFFDQLDAPNHVAGGPDDPRIPESVLGRAMVVRRLDMVPFECVARGYLTGSGRREYDERGSVCGIELPEGLVEASRLEPPIFTPATKAAQGEHDENVSVEYVAERLGREAAEELKDATLSLYEKAADIARERGIILADTKLEFGRDDNGRLVLADEVFTPDSSRYWPLEGYEAGRSQPSFDKQYVRDWLTSEESGWDRASGEEPPRLPGSVVERTRERYVEAYERITGASFADWLGARA